MEQKELNKLWKAVEVYINSLKEKIPFTLLLSRGYNIDDRKEWEKLKKVFNQPNNKKD